MFKWRSVFLNVVSVEQMLLATHGIASQRGTPCPAPAVRTFERALMAVGALIPNNA